MKVGEAEQADVSAVVVVVVVESTVKGALWDSACLSSGLNVTDDRDHWSIFSHQSEPTPFHNFIVYYRDTDAIVKLLHCLYLVPVVDKWVLVVLFLTGVNTSHFLLFYSIILVSTFDLVLPQGFRAPQKPPAEK